MGIKVFSGVLPGAACLLGALLLMWYPLRGAYLEEMQHKVLMMHHEKKGELERRLSAAQD
jgi:glycoside/pentoside/hexuronide:cation symporter, GPH family